MKTMIGIVGYSCSGKTSLVTFLEKKGFHIFRNELSFPSYAHIPKDMNRGKILEIYGRNESIFYCLQGALLQSLACYDVIFIDSLKQKYDLIVLPELFPQVKIKILFLDAPFEVRLKQFIKRAREEICNEYVLRARDNEDLRFGIMVLKANATWIIDTSEDISIWGNDILDELKNY